MLLKSSNRHFVVLLTFLLAALSAGARTNVATIAELKELFKTRQQDLGFRISGTVMHFGGKGMSLVLGDETGAIELFGAVSEALPVGTAVTVKGRFGITPNGEPWSNVEHIENAGNGRLPPVLDVPLSDLDDPQTELRNVRVTGTVVDVFADDLGPEVDFVLIKDGETTVPVICSHDPSLKGLIDARVRVTGLNRHHISSYRKHTSPCVFATGRPDITIVSPPPADPFAFPALEEDLYVNPRQIARRGKRSVIGTVLATWQPNNVLIRTDRNRIVRLSLRADERLPAGGLRCTAAGHPLSDTYHVNLTYARVRTEDGPATADERPEETTAERILLNDSGELEIKSVYHGRLISLTGVVRSVPASDIDRRQLLLDCGKLKVPVDFSACPDALRDIAPGSTVAATGRCVLDISPWSANDVLPRFSGLLLVARSADDFRVLVPPPWLTVGKLTVFVVVLLLSLLAVFVRNRIVRRISRKRLAERTQLAVELHDSLSQSLAGIAYQITAAQRDGDKTSADAKLTTADQMLQSCRRELRHCLFDLRNDTTGEKIFDRAIRRTIEEFEEQVALSIRFNVNRSLFDDATVHAVLAIVRELVSNAITHGHAWAIRIAGSADKGILRFSVRDDGVGFDPLAAPGASDGHFGLTGIHDRVKRLNGTFAIRRARPRGTKAIITIPFK